MENSKEKRFPEILSICPLNTWEYKQKQKQNKKNVNSTIETYFSEKLSIFQ